MKAKFNLRPDSKPTIYAYEDLDPRTKGKIKVGYTTRSVAQRMAEHFPTAHIEGLTQYKVIFEEPGMRDDGTTFTDHEIHSMLKANGIERVGGEWFKCSLKELRRAYNSVKLRKDIDIERSWSFKMRPEQKKAVDITKKYFLKFRGIEKKAPHFLWNCKMRFGKTFAAYKLAEEMNWKRVLVLTYMPAVQNSWKEDLLYHTDFENWEFIDALEGENIGTKKKGCSYVCFASFQDFLGKNKVGGLKVKNAWAHKVDWDCIILDEYHHGAWNEKSKQLYMTNEDKAEFNEEHEFNKESGISSWSKNQGIWSEDLSPLKTKNYLYLSGTPFRAIATGEFLEEQIYNWTYYDEQYAKKNFKGSDNPYVSLPKMVMLTYKMPESITHFVKEGEEAEFDLNEFFKAEGNGDQAHFKHENYVQKWLDLIRGHGFRDIYLNSNTTDKPVLPYFDARLRNNLTHTLWFLPSVASCHAMKNLLESRINSFYNETYKLLVCAGNDAGIGTRALPPLRKLMSDPLKTKTITFTCGKLCTGVTVKPWSGVFMLRNTSSPEKYFQTAFRAQSSWTVPSENKNKANEEKIMKEECYLFDFSPNRSLRLVTEYSSKLDISEKSTEEKINEFIKFLPVLCFDGSQMYYIDANDILDFGMVGISGSQLARKFQSARLINVDDLTLKRILDDEKALSAVMSIEGFRNINQDLKTESDAKNNDQKKKTISDEEKKQKSKRKEIQDRLRKFATRIPIFMYLTDYREEALEDVIKDIEPSLFRNVTGITKEQFKILVKLGLFNRPLMNAAVLGFKRYENASLHYDGLTKHNRAVLGLEPASGTSEERVGAYDTVVTSQEFLEEDF
jgi:hypothetical protein